MMAGAIQVTRAYRGEHVDGPDRLGELIAAIYRIGVLSERIPVLHAAGDPLPMPCITPVLQATTPIPSVRRIATAFVAEVPRMAQHKRIDLICRSWLASER